MMWQKGRNYYFWSIFFTISLVILQGCGSGKRGALNELEIQIQIPEGEVPEYFWYGVAKKIIRVKPEGKEAVEFNWEPGKSIEIDLEKGDKVHFFASDVQGRTLVEGEEEVSEEKKVSIPVHRVL